MMLCHKHLCPEMHITRYMFNFHKCQVRVRVRVRVSLSVNPLFVTLGLAFVFGLSLRFGLGLLCLSSRGEEIRDKRHFMTFIVCISC